MKVKQFQMLAAILIVGFVTWKGMEYQYRERDQPITLVYAVQERDSINPTQNLKEGGRMKHLYDSSNIGEPTTIGSDENAIDSSKTTESQTFQSTTSQLEPVQALPQPPAQQTASQSPMQQTSQPSSNGTPDKGIGSLDINKATQAQLEQVKGIGEVKARALLDYIKSHGPIADMNQLLNVNGIGEKTLTALKEKFSVQ